MKVRLVRLRKLTHISLLSSQMSPAVLLYKTYKLYFILLQLILKQAL